MILAYILSALSYIAGVGLNVTSGWLITMASFMPPVLTLSVAVVMVRFFGITRAVTRYLERIISHKSVFNKLAALRSDLYKRITSNPKEVLIAGSGGKLIKQVVDDVERAQEYELRITLPGAAALVTMFAASLLALWLQPLMGILWLAITLLMAILIPRAAAKQMVGRAVSIENLESLYANKVRNSVHGALEAEIYGYLNEVLDEVEVIEREINEEERALLKIIRR